MLRRGIARRLIAFRIDPQVLTRIEVLGELANAGNLTADERSESTPRTLFRSCALRRSGISRGPTTNSGCRNPAVRPAHWPEIVASTVGFVRSTARFRTRANTLLPANTGAPMISRIWRSPAIAAICTKARTERGSTC